MWIVLADQVCTQNRIFWFWKCHWRNGHIKAKLEALFILPFRFFRNPNLGFSRSITNSEGCSPNTPKDSSPVYSFCMTRVAQKTMYHYYRRRWILLLIFSDEKYQEQRASVCRGSLLQPSRSSVPFLALTIYTYLVWSLKVFDKKKGETRVK